MRHLWEQLLWDPIWTQGLLLRFLDIGLVLLLIYVVLVIISERRSFWMVRGFIGLILVRSLSEHIGLRLLSFVLGYLIIGSAVAMAIMLQSGFRHFLEHLGQGELLQLLQPQRTTNPKPGTIIDEIVDAVKELSQNRTGALLVLETGSPIDDQDFEVAGVKLNADVSRELIQTIFQTSTLLHDGAILIRASHIIAAGIILPLSERAASRRLGTRHRAAMGITERVNQSVCVVVSEETGSISLAHRGILDRPLTSSKLKDRLETHFSHTLEGDTVRSDLRSLGRQLKEQGTIVASQLMRFSSMILSRGQNK